MRRIAVEVSLVGIATFAGGCMGQRDLLKRVEGCADACTITASMSLTHGERLDAHAASASVTAQGGSNDAPRTCRPVVGRVRIACR